MCPVERDPTHPAQDATLASKRPTTSRDARCRGRPALDQGDLDTRQRLRRSSEGRQAPFEFALGAQPVSELVGAALFEVNDVRALGDLVVSGLAGLRLGRSRVRSVTGGPCGIGGHDGSPLSRSTRWVQAASRRRPLYRGQRAFRARHRSSTHIDAGPPGDDVICSPIAELRPVQALRADLTPTRQLDQATKCSHPS